MKTALTRVRGLIKRKRKSCSLARLWASGRPTGRRGLRWRRMTRRSRPPQCGAAQRRFAWRFPRCFDCASTWHGGHVWRTTASACAATSGAHVAPARWRYSHHRTLQIHGTPRFLKTGAAATSTKCGARPGRRSTTSCSAATCAGTTRTATSALRCGRQCRTLARGRATHGPCSTPTAPRRTLWTSRGPRSRCRLRGRSLRGLVGIGHPAARVECMRPQWPQLEPRCARTSAASAQAATAGGW